MGILQFVRNRLFENRSNTARPRLRVISGASSPPTPQPAEQQSLPLLFVLARNCAWDAVLFRLQSHPEEAFFVDTGDRDNIFHVVCMGHPNDAGVVSALLSTVHSSFSSKSMVDLLGSPDRNGCLPLHHACSYRCSPEIVQLLISAYPEATTATATTTGFTPLHSLCNSGIVRVPEVLQILLRHTPPTVCQYHDSHFGRTPLGWIHTHRINRWQDLTLLDLMRIRQRQKALRHELKYGRRPEDWPEHAALTQELIDALEEEVVEYRDGDFWQCVAQLVVKESSLASSCLVTNEVELSSPFVILCACFEVQHMEEWAILLYEPCLHQLNTTSAVTTTMRSPLHWAACRGQRALVEQLVGVNPELAAVRDRDGRTPLQLWSSRENPYALIDAYPLALLSLRDEQQDPGAVDRFIASLLPLLSVQSLFVLLRDGELIGRLQLFPSTATPTESRTT